MAVRTLTDVEIFNQALIRLGQTSYLVAAVDGTDTTKFGKLAYPMYFATRDEELRSGVWKVAVKRAQLTQAAVNQSALGQTSSWTNNSNVMTVTDSSKIVVGWLVTATIIQGGGAITTPAGIPSGTTVVSITDSTHIVLSANATANGNGPVVFQVNNLTGYWYAYQAPNDILFARSIAAIFPNFVYLWPFKVQHQLKFTYIYENGYFYTDLDPNNGNPILEYIVELTSAAIYATGTWTNTTVITCASAVQSWVGALVTGAGIPLGAIVVSVTTGASFTISGVPTSPGTGAAITLNPQTTFDFDFAEALVNRLAMKLARPVTMSEGIKKDAGVDYSQTIVRAANNNAKEASDLQPADPWWFDRRR